MVGSSVQIMSPLITLRRRLSLALRGRGWAWLGPNKVDQMDVNARSYGLPWLRRYSSIKSRHDNTKHTTKIRLTRTAQRGNVVELK